MDQAITALIETEKPDVSWVGIGLSISSVMVMPWLGVQKKRIGERIGSRATTGEGTQNLLCAYLAAALLVGLLGNALFGLWWLDPVVGLMIAAVAIREGMEAWEGGECGCASSPFPLDRDREAQQ